MITCSFVQTAISRSCGSLLEPPALEYMYADIHAQSRPPFTAGPYASALHVRVVRVPTSRYYLASLAIYPCVVPLSTLACCLSMLRQCHSQCVEI